MKRVAVLPKRIMHVVRRVAKGMLKRKWAEVEYGLHVIRASRVPMFMWKKE